MEISRKIISNELCEKYENAKYRVKTITPYVNSSCKNTYIFDQIGLDEFLKHYDEFVEFLVSIKRVR